MIEHYHAYNAPISHGPPCRDLPGLMRLSLLDCNGPEVSPEQAQNPDLPQLAAGTSAPYEIKVGDRMCIRVENAAEVAISATLIDCAASGRVLILGEKRIPPRSRHVFWFMDVLGKPFAASLPDDRSLGVDRITAIATTRPDVSMKYLEPRTSFAELITPDAKSRSLSDSDGADAGPPAERWTSAMTALRITRRLSHIRPSRLSAACVSLRRKTHESGRRMPGCRARRRHPRRTTRY